MRPARQWANDGRMQTNLNELATPGARRNKVVTAAEAVRLIHDGDTVATGTRIGRITDFHGNVLQDVTAPFAGIVLYVLGTPPISKGEPVAFVGQVQK